jgi:hypothetical protein
VLKPDATLSDLRPAINRIIENELADIGSFCRRLARGEMAVC